MANEITKGNLVVAGVIAFFGCPALLTSMLTFVAPAVLRVAAPIVCSDGEHVVTDYVTHSDFRGSRTDVRAACVDARGHSDGQDVSQEGFAVVYGAVLLLWGVSLAIVFRPATGSKGTGA